jgi:hypothetical protein
VNRVAFEYLYRDAANYKTWGRVVFANPRSRRPAELASLVRPLLIDGQWFDADAWGVPDLRGQRSRDDALDHGWHEFVRFVVVPVSQPAVVGEDRAVDAWIAGLASR